MSPKNNINSLKLSYIFWESEKLFYLRMGIIIPVTPSSTYQRKLLDVNGKKIRILFEETDSMHQQRTIFSNTVLARLNIKVSKMETYTTKKLRTIITSHFRNQEEAFAVNVIFQKPDGTITNSLGEYISEDADIDFYE